MSNVKFLNMTKLRIFNKLNILFFLANSLILVYIYRLGSLRVDKGQTPGLRDIGTYFRGGLAIISGENPYEDPYFRIGPTGGLILGLLAKSTPDSLSATFIQVLSVFGFVYFIGRFAGYGEIKTFPWTFLGIIVFISSQRENLVNIQITGILALLVAFGFRLTESDNCALKVVGLLFVAIAVETKPHLLSLFVILILLQLRKTIYLVGIFSIILLLHALISLHIQELVTLSWLRLIFGLGKDATSGQLPERIAFETPFRLIGVNSTSSVIIMSIVFCILFTLLVCMAQRKKVSHLGLLAPSFGIFFHYYDLALAFGLILTMLYKNNEYKVLFMALGVYLVPQNFFTISNASLVSLLLGLLATSLFGKSLVLPHFTFSWESSHGSLTQFSLKFMTHKLIGTN